MSCASPRTGARNGGCATRSKREQLAADLAVLENFLVQTDWTLKGAAIGRSAAKVMPDTVGLAGRADRMGGALTWFERRLTGAQTFVIYRDVELISCIGAETLVLDFGHRIAFDRTPIVLADPTVKAAHLGIEA